MATLVVDASVALAWALPDEISAYADAALAVVEKSVLRVPELWPREVANGSDHCLSAQSPDDGG